MAITFPASLQDETNAASPSVVLFSDRSTSSAIAAASLSDRISTASDKRLLSQLE